MENFAAAATGGIIGLLLVAIVGLVIGAIAKLLMPGPDSGGWFSTILLGIAGSWFGGFIFSSLGLTGLALSLLGAVLGAMALLLIFRLIKRKS
jgi:uncharacterized membrane protein YeaQ/YmgE (transglycosylase-associated protein family)